MPARACALAVVLFLPSVLITAQSPASGEDSQLDRDLTAIAQAHRGKVTLYAHNLRTGETASLSADEPVKTASTIKMAILLNAAQQIRAGRATFDERLVLNKANQVEGSGVLGVLTPPLPLTLRDTLTLMVVLSDNTATNMAIDRLGLDAINSTLRGAGLRQTWLYKKVYVPASGPMPADQPKFGLGKTTAREMASIMERLATCNLSREVVTNHQESPTLELAPKAQLAPPQVAQVAPPQVAQVAPPQVAQVVCGAILQMLHNQQDRDSLPRYLETLDTSENGSAIANKTGALDAVRNDVALISSKAGPIVIAAFTYDNADQRWTGDNEAEQTLGKLAKAVIDHWSPQGLDPKAFPWDDPLAAASPQR